MSGDTQWVIDSDGALVAYDDRFAVVDQSMVERAMEGEAVVQALKAQIDWSFVEMSVHLANFEHHRHYLARGYERMRDWAESPEIELSWRVTTDLLRIAREAIPLVEEALGGDARKAREVLARAGVSKVRAALPLLREEQGKARFLDMIAAAQHTPYRDFVNEVKSLRGIETPIDQPNPAVFMARVRRGESFHTVTVTCSDGMDAYDVGRLRVKPHHWARWEARFGDFCEFEDE